MFGISTEMFVISSNIFEISNRMFEILRPKLLKFRNQNVRDFGTKMFEISTFFEKFSDKRHKNLTQIPLIMHRFSLVNSLINYQKPNIDVQRPKLKPKT